MRFYARVRRRSQPLRLPSRWSPRLAPAGQRERPPTAYQMPFPCGETWSGATRAGHSPSVNAIDWNRNPDLGAPVVAAAPGVVTTSYATPKGGYGRWVVIDHGNGESSLYAHLRASCVAVGQRVDQGAHDRHRRRQRQRLSGAHLHFEEQSGRSVVPAWFAGSALQEPVRSRPGTASTSRWPATSPATAAAEVAVFRRAKKSSFRRQRRRRRTPLTVKFGKAFDEPLLGDWNGDGQRRRRRPHPAAADRSSSRRPTGVTKLQLRQALRHADQRRLGRRRPHRDRGPPGRPTGTFWPRMADGSTAPVWLGDADDLPVTGDWDGNGTTDLGVFDQATATFTLRSVDAAGLSVLEVVQFGVAGDLPVTGDWDGDGVTDLGRLVARRRRPSPRRHRAPLAARRRRIGHGALGHPASLTRTAVRRCGASDRGSSRRSGLVASQKVRRPVLRAGEGERPAAVVLSCGEGDRARAGRPAS